MAAEPVAPQPPVAPAEPTARADEEARGRERKSQVWKWLLLCLLLLLAALLFRVSFFAFAMYAMIALLLASQVMGGSALRDLGVERVCRWDHADIGARLPVTVELTNAKPLPILWLLLEDSLPPHLPVDGHSGLATLLFPRQHLRLKYEVICAYRGYHQIGPLVLESGDLFGLIRRFRTAGERRFITVYPKVVPIGTWRLGSPRPIGDVRVRSPLFEDPTRMAGVREYRTGDPLNRVHWRATARTGRLHSKIYEQSAMIGANVVLDFSRDAWGADRPIDDRELAVTAAASIAAFMVEQKQQIGLITNGGDAAERVKREVAHEAESRQEAEAVAREMADSDRLRPLQVPLGKGAGQYLQIMEALARVEMRDALDLPQLITREYEAWPREATLIFITPRVPPALAQQLARLRTVGFIVAVLIARDPDEYHQARARLAGYGIDVLPLMGEADLNALAAIPF